MSSLPPLSFLMPTMTTACPCGGASFATCCAAYIGGAALPPSAATLMRSRYSAYVLCNESYLRATWHASTCPADAIVSDDKNMQWLGLEIRSALSARQPETPASVDNASVEFVARYKIAGRAHRLHEVSTFVREGGRWFYVDGHFPASTPRNAR
jgi:SEC-C motif-containing protein